MCYSKHRYRDMLNVLLSDFPDLGMTRDEELMMTVLTMKSNDNEQEYLTWLKGMLAVACVHNTLLSSVCLLMEAAVAMTGKDFCKQCDAFMVSDRLQELRDKIGESPEVETSLHKCGFKHDLH